MATESTEMSSKVKQKGIHAHIYSDSNFKNLESGNGVSIDFPAIRGGNIEDLQRVVKRHAQDPDIILLHMGTNDLNRLDYANNCPIVISGILPGQDRPDLNPLRLAGNNLLATMTSDKGEKFSYLSWDETFKTTNYDIFGIIGMISQELHQNRKESNRRLQMKIKRE